LLDVDIAEANGALINILGGQNLTLSEAKQVVQTVSERISEDARVIWGAQISEDLGNNVRVLLILTGVKSTQILGPPAKQERGKRKKEIETELGIEFLD
jgi:cell division protein FtsZ